MFLKSNNNHVMNEKSVTVLLTLPFSLKIPFLIKSSKSLRWMSSLFLPLSQMSSSFSAIILLPVLDRKINIAFLKKD
jgi:hypothetical protein